MNSWREMNLQFGTCKYIMKFPILAIVSVEEIELAENKVFLSQR
jgi:hypothetical protein